MGVRNSSSRVMGTGKRFLDWEFFPLCTFLEVFSIANFQLRFLHLNLIFSTNRAESNQTRIIHRDFGVINCVLVRCCVKMWGSKLEKVRVISTPKNQVTTTNFPLLRISRPQFLKITPSFSGFNMLDWWYQAWIQRDLGAHVTCWVLTGMMMIVNIIEVIQHSLS